MMKFNWLLALVLTLLVMGCESESKYTALGKELATRLDKAVEKQDTAAALAADVAIRENEKQIIELSDSAAIADFHNAVNESRQRNAAYLATIKVNNGKTSEDAVGEVVQDVMDRNLSISAVTESIDSVMRSKQEK